MIYFLLRLVIPIVLWLTGKKISFNTKSFLNHKGPLLLAANHPNSFLDAVLLCAYFKQPIRALARGDAFNKKWTAKLLSLLYMMPVYREREGSSQLGKNYDTFEACLNVFQQNGIVLIFSEALCINEWHLRPLRKGTARLAHMAWQQNIPVEILPVGINYSHFNGFGKHIVVNFGSILQPSHYAAFIGLDGQLNSAVTTDIKLQLEKAVFEINEKDAAKKESLFKLPNANLISKICWLPSLLGQILHAPFYFPLKKLLHNKFRASDHFDSLYFGVFFFTYPLYLILLALALQHFGFSMLLLLLSPFFIWCRAQVKSVK